jgi:hypothetical protein
VHVAFVLFLCFMVFPVRERFRHRVMWWDWLAAALAIAIVVYAIQGGDDFTDRNTSPLPWDIVFGSVLIVLVLEAMRRTSGWDHAGDHAGLRRLRPRRPVACRRRGRTRATRSAGWSAILYMTLEGIFGVAVDVASSLIILFTIYGAFLQYLGAGKFYLDFSFSAMGGKPTGAGRTVVLASFLLGGPSGSGVATTVTLGAVAYPLLEKVGYEKNAAGGLLAAGRLGAIISPPVLGRSRLPDRRVPEDLVPRRSPDGVHPDAAVLSRAVSHGRDRRTQVRHARRRLRARRHGVEPEQALLVPLPVAGLDRRLHALGLLAGARGVLGDGGRARHQHAAAGDGALLLRPLPRQEPSPGASAEFRLRQGDGRGRHRHAQRRRDLRRGRDHRRRRRAHRPGPQVQLDRHRLRPGLAPADRDLHLARRSGSSASRCR